MERPAVGPVRLSLSVVVAGFTAQLHRGREHVQRDQLRVRVGNQSVAVSRQLDRGVSGDRGVPLPERRAAASGPDQLGRDEYRVQLRNRAPSTAATSTSSPGHNCPTARFTTPARFASPQITDGLSNTAGYSETILGNNITTTPGGTPPSIRNAQYALFNETTITNIPPALFLPPNMLPSEVFHTGLVGGRPGPRMVAWKLHHGRLSSIFTRQTASIRIAPTTAETPR